MAAFVNDRYTRLQATTPRYLPASVGVQSGVVTIYRRTSSATAPALPSAAATFTFSTGALTGLTNSWTTTLPPLSDGAYLWSSVVYFGSSSSATYSVTAASWPTARLIYDAATIVQAQADATAANTALTAIADDNKLSKGEKPEVILRWNTIVGEVSGLQTQADALVVSRTSFDGAYTTLLNYLNSINTTPAWTDVLVDTPITGTTFRTNFLNYYNAKATLVVALTAKANSNAAAAQGSADAANAAFALIADDNILSRAEKPAVLREWTTTDTEAPLLRAQADALLVSRSAYDAAKQALSDYLTSIPNGWATMNTDSAINGADFRTNWNNYYAAKLNLLNAISAKAATAPSLTLGGGNLLRYSGQFKDTGIGWASSGSTLLYDSSVLYGGFRTLRISGAGGAFNTNLMRLKPNTVYTVSAMVRADAVISNVSTQQLHVQVWTDENTSNVHQENIQNYDQSIPTINVWKKVWCTFLTPNSATLVYHRLYFYPLAAGLDLWVGYAKVEEGNKPSDWSPAPEDMVAEIDAIASDNVLSKGEKSYLIREWASIDGEYAPLRDQADALLVSRTTYAAAYAALNSYLGGLSPAYSDVTQDTTIVGATFHTKFSDYYVAKGVLQNAIAAKAAFAPSAIIGGANLYPDGGFERGTHPCSSRSAVSAMVFDGAGTGLQSYSGSKFLFFDSAAGSSLDMYLYIGGDPCPVKAGKQYKYSFMYATATNSTITSGSCYLRLSNGDHVGVPIPVLNTGGPWVLCEFDWTCPAGITTVEARFGLICNNYSWMAVDCIQMEEGNKRTQWTPALVDLQADAQAKADAAQAAAISTAAAAAQAKADLAETTAKAYADGIVTDEEARAILDATNKANAAQSAAQSAAAADATAKANAAALTANWSGVANNDGNKPANGATVGAPSGTNVGSTPATTVESKANGAIPDAAGTVATGNIANDGVSGVDVFSTIPVEATAQFVVSVDSKVLVLASIANNPGSGSQGYNIDKFVSGTTWTLAVASYYMVNANSSNLFTLAAGTYRFYPLAGSGYVTNVTVLKIKK